MPVHDWSKVPDGTFHHFHLTWIALLSDALNEKVLPTGYYAMAEQVVGFVPDVLTLQAVSDERKTGDGGTTSFLPSSGNGTTLVTSPPRATVHATLEEAAIYAAKANRLVIRHQSHDKVVAMLEIVSAGNKSTQRAPDNFVKKAIDALWEGIHLLIIDLHAPTRRDPQGIHGAIWQALNGIEYSHPRDKPLTLAAYSGWSGDDPIEAFVEPLGVGDALPPMPLFLAPGSHVVVPLEASYMTAVRKIPARARAPLEN